MASKRLHRWWLGACVVATFLANWAGGFSLLVTAVFVVIYLTGAALIGRDADPEDADAEDADAGSGDRPSKRENSEQ